MLLSCRPLLIYAACTLMFHFANAPLLPLVGQKLALAHKELATAMMSSCIVAAQLIMLPIALAVGRYTDVVGRKPILMVGFAILPVRAFLYMLSNNAAWLIGVQLLDGVGAGVWGAITPLVVADVMHGTGRFNIAQGAVMTSQGIGASLSGLAGRRIGGSFRLYRGVFRRGRGGRDGVCCSDVVHAGDIGKPGSASHADVSGSRPPTG